MENILALLESALHSLATEPLTTAARLDEIGDILKDYAARIREALRGHAPTSPGGLGDSCHIRVGGPDGKVTQETDTRITT